MINKLIAAALLTVAVCHPINAQQNMENVLNERQRNMVAIACLEAKGDLENLSEAIHTGLDEGLTISEIKKHSHISMPTPVFPAASMVWESSGKYWWSARRRAL